MTCRQRFTLHHLPDVGGGGAVGGSYNAAEACANFYLRTRFSSHARRRRTDVEGWADFIIITTESIATAVGTHMRDEYSTRSAG